MSRESVYELLQRKSEDFVSGQELSHQLGISRAAVWKAVEGLRRDGYIIEARTGLGYHLTASPDSLVNREVRRFLRVDCPHLRCLETVDSTNSYLKREALMGAAHGTVVTANTQTAGRGRMTRTFVSPPNKGVYLSVLFRPQLPPAALVAATSMAALAVCNAVERIAGVRPGIKWPNDLVLGGRKLCGILTELSVEGESGAAETLIIGAGVNVSQTPEDFGPVVAKTATSLALEGYKASRPALAAAMIEEFYRVSDCLGGDLSGWIAAYRKDCVALGKPIRLLWAEQETEAVALDVDDRFGLVVRMPDGRETTVRTGEVSVRGMHGYVE